MPMEKEKVKRITDIVINAIVTILSVLTGINLM